MPRKQITAMIEELRSWLPNYDRGEKEYPTLLFRVLASLPGGEELEDMGYETFNLGWHEADQLGRMLETIQDKGDVEDLVRGLMNEEEEDQPEEAKRRRPARARAQEQGGTSLLDALVAAGIEVDHHESDLYVPSTPEAWRIIQTHDGGKWAKSATVFVSQIDQKQWIDVPFAYTPHFNKHQRPATPVPQLPPPQLNAAPINPREQPMRRGGAMTPPRPPVPPPHRAPPKRRRRSSAAKPQRRRSRSR